MRSLIIKFELNEDPETGKGSILIDGIGMDYPMSMEQIFTIFLVSAHDIADQTLEENGNCDCENCERVNKMMTQSLDFMKYQHSEGIVGPVQKD